jgi:D-alanyl-D-alanine carboxypeptidase/D-alanyl-D-alanine-endopeptidase (penicillin-binding protein 4)
MKPRTLLPLLTLFLTVAQARGGELQDQVRKLVSATGPRQGVTSVSVRDPSGQQVVSLQADAPLMPASNQKLLTTGAALRVLGPEFTFQTRLLRRGDRLTLVGDGDPALGDPELLDQMDYLDEQGQWHRGTTIDGLVDRWAQAARQAGMTRVSELVIDDRVFDRSTCHVDWPVDQLNESYCAEVSGVNFHLNCLTVWAAPSARGAVVTRTEPCGDFVRIENRTAVARKKKGSIWIQREPDENRFTMRGFLTGKGESSHSVTVCEPAMFFGQYLADRLRKAGVEVQSLRLAAVDDPPAGGEPIGPIMATPLHVVLSRCNRDSENLYAESLLKRIGHAVSQQPGSWENGGKAVSGLVVRRVGGGGGVEIADGSGMSRENQLTTSVLSAWIQDLVRDPQLADPFLRSLAVGGKTGTVKRRFGDIDPRLATIRCKTGYIDGVSSLSGVVECQNGLRVPFSIISNGFRGDDLARARQMQEAIVKAIVTEYARRPSLQPPAERPALGGG